MKLEIIWIRHGESLWNAAGKWQGHTDSELSALGRLQAERLGERFVRAGYRFDAIYTSDLTRAHQTATLAAAGQKLVVDSRLREINFGRFEGCSPKDLTLEEQEEVRQWWRFPYRTKIGGGGESMACLRSRVDQWMKELPQNGRVAVFTHGGVIRDALWRETGPPQDGSWSFWINNSSLTVIRYSSDRNLITRVNDDAHTEGL